MKTKLVSIETSVTLQHTRTSRGHGRHFEAEQQQQWPSLQGKEMSTVAQCVSGFGQGADTSAVLTNRSKYITVIADEPYFSRHSRCNTFPQARHRKGTRPMHKSTLTYEVKPVKTSYVSCMKSVGKYFSILTAW